MRVSIVDTFDCSENCEKIRKAFPTYENINALQFERNKFYSKPFFKLIGGRQIARNYLD